MSPALHPPGRSPPDRDPATPYYPRPVILPPGPRTSRSFVLAAARLRALHLDPQRDPTEASQLSRECSTIPSPAAPVFIESGPLEDT
jgi:hypothetical protein